MSRIAVIGIAGNSVFLPVERFHVGGETVEAFSAHAEPGGKGFNQAVAASRTGAKVSFLAAVGRNGKRTIEAFLRAEGISATLVQKESGSAFAAIVTDKRGSNRVTVYQGAQLSDDDVVSFSDEIRTADILLLNNEVDEVVNIRAIRIAKEHGVKVILNPAPARKYDEFVLQNTDLFTPNEHETAGIEDFPNVIVTLGAKGCRINRDNQIIPAYPSGEVIDTTGAGDTFNGVLAAMLAEGKTLPFAAKIANKVAGLGVTRRYAVSSIPTKEEIQTILKKTRE